MSLLENHCQPIWGPGDIDFLFQMFSAIQLESTSLRESIPLIYDEIKLHAYRCSFRKLLKIESIIFMKDEITVNGLHAIISTVFQLQTNWSLQNHMIKDQHVIFSYHMVENGDGLKNESLLCTVLALYCLLWTNYELYHWCWHRRHHWTGSRSWHGLWFFLQIF